MRKNKFILGALILLLCLLCISAVSAADDDAASDIDAYTSDETVLGESIDDADLRDSQSEENILKESDYGEESLGDNAETGSFYDLNYDVNNGNEVVELTRDYSWLDVESDQSYKDGIRINHNVTINGNGHTINGSGQARIFYVPYDSSVTFNNIVFANGYRDGEDVGGAIYGVRYTSKAINCTFIENQAHKGGAIHRCDAIDCTFISNKARDGGAIYDSNATNSIFTQNNAEYGGAIAYGNAIGCRFENNSASTNGGAIYIGDAENSIFINNSARTNGGALFRGNALNSAFTGNLAINGSAIYNADAINCSFTGNNASDSGAIYDGNANNCNFTGNNASENGAAICNGNAENCIFTSNIASFKGGAIYNGNAIDSTFTSNQATGGGAICGDTDDDNIQYASAINCTFNNNRALVGGATFLTNVTNSSFTGNALITEYNLNGSAMSSSKEYPCLALNCIFTNNNAGGFKAINYAIADSCIFNGDEVDNETVVVYNPTLKNFNFISTYNDDSLLVVNITSKSGMQIANANIKVDVYTATGTFVGTYNIKSGGWKLPFGAGAYTATYNATDYDIDNVEGLIIVDKSNATVSSNAVAAVYNKNKYLIITLKDSKGRAISGAELTVTLGSAKLYTTDKNGQIKINVGKLVPKAYTAKISFAENENYLASSTTAKVTVKKATPKLTAKKKTFKLKVKVKKYKITLKNNVKKAIKGAKVTLKVNKKTFKATTNSKGVATFKIKNLKKKGKYNAVIKFAGNKYYNKLSKKAKITVKK